jgi:hypothetical protein
MSVNVYLGQTKDTIVCLRDFYPKLVVVYFELLKWCEKAQIWLWLISSFLGGCGSAQV